VTLYWMKARDSFKRHNSLIKQFIGNRGCGSRTRAGQTHCVVCGSDPPLSFVNRSELNCDQDHQKVAAKSKLAMHRALPTPRAV